MFDLLSDISSSLGRNKLRTFLTGFSMAWGVFMLVILLGCGNGLKNATLGNYADRSNNYITIWPGRTSIPYKGLQTGRRMKIDEKVVAVLGDDFPNVRSISTIRAQYNVTKTVGAEYVTGTLFGVTPERFSIERANIVEGRLLNMMDMQAKRKVIVMHRKNAETLFKGRPALGQYVIVGGVGYQVVGIFKDRDNSQTPGDYIPLPTLEMIYPSADGYNSITVETCGIETKKDCEKFENDLRSAMASVMQFSPQDKSAVWIWNAMSDYIQTMGIFRGITLFLWLVGLGTLVAGIVGISNIMLVTVRERTKEFGIRKSLGAKPRNIMALILSESLVITSLFGYIGMLLGVLVLGGLSKIFPAVDPDAPWGDKPTVFANPQIDIWIAVAAVLILVAAGVAAAYIPAKKAVEIKPIEALHYE